MERLSCAHTCIDGIGLGIGGGIPALFDMGRSGVESVISLIIEGDCFESAWSLLDIGAGSNFIISEEEGAICVSLRVYAYLRCTSVLQK